MSTIYKKKMIIKIIALLTLLFFLLATIQTFIKNSNIDIPVLIVIIFMLCLNIFFVIDSFKSKLIFDGDCFTYMTIFRRCTILKKEVNTKKSLVEEDLRKGRFIIVKNNGEKIRIYGIDTFTNKRDGEKMRRLIDTINFFTNPNADSL